MADYTPEREGRCNVFLVSYARSRGIPSCGDVLSLDSPSQPPETKLPRLLAAASTRPSFGFRMREQFEQIYDKNLWGGSGEGSHPRHTRGYARFLARFLRENQVRSVLDLGCGDWQFSRFIDWAGIRYQGFDLVRSVVERNRELYSAPNISFYAYEGDLGQLPPADLFIAKDVLQHWSNESVRCFLPYLKNYRLALLTNCVRPDGGPTANEDDVDGGARYLDLQRPPFSLAGDLVYSFTNHERFWLRPFRSPRWRKHVLLVRS